MCGRFSLATSKEKLQQQLPFVDVAETLRVSYNIAPMGIGATVVQLW